MMVKGEAKAQGKIVDLNSPENVAAHSKFKAMANAQEQKIAEVARLFDPVALMNRAGEIHEVKHPQLGTIKYRELMLSDSEIISKCTTKDDKSAMAIYLMLKKAYPQMPDYTPETIAGFYRAFPMAEGTSLLQFFLSQPCFLGEKSANGSNQTQAPTN